VASGRTVARRAGAAAEASGRTAAHQPARPAGRASIEAMAASIGAGMRRGIETQYQARGGMLLAAVAAAGAAAITAAAPR
jgi:hypothetical protein